VPAIAGGREVVRMVTFGDITVKEQLGDDTTPLPSVTTTVKTPPAMGVPLRAPVEVLSVRPVGRVPLPIEKTNGEVPPVTVMLGLFTAEPAVNELIPGHVSVGPAATAKAQLGVAVTPLESVAWMVKEPLAVGVPVMAPVEALSVRPAGRVDPLATVKVKGPTPPAGTIAELLKAAPTSPLTAGQGTVGAAAMVKAQLGNDVIELESVTLRVKVPVPWGVPVMAPVEVLSVKPKGSDPLATEKV
jgi:hypothetical protein